MEEELPFTCLPEYFLLSMTEGNLTCPIRLSYLDVEFHLDNLKGESSLDDEVEDDGYYPIVYFQRDAKIIESDQQRLKIWCLATRKSLISHIQSETFFSSIPSGSLCLEGGLNREIEEVATIIVTDWPNFPKNVYLVFRVVRAKKTGSKIVNLDEFLIRFGIGSGGQHIIGDISRKELDCSVLLENDDQIKDWVIQYLKNERS
jgi:hypothetical protein